MLAWNRLVAAVLAQFLKMPAFDAFHFDIPSIFKECNPCFNLNLLAFFFSSIHTPGRSPKNSNWM